MSSQFKNYNCSRAGTLEFNPARNRLLAALRHKLYARLLPHLEFVKLPLGFIVYDLGDCQEYVYFPTTSIVSLFCVLENGSSSEVAVVGNDGFVGISVILADNIMHNRAVIQSAGAAYRLKSTVLKGETAYNSEILGLLLRYTEGLIIQIAQNVVCNRHHSTHQKLCRRILMSLDRLPLNDLMLTQEMISKMLGVNRLIVSQAARRLQSAGVIYYGRGKITVLDRPKLEQQACECYRIAKQKTDALFPPHSA